jgi:Fe2+ transport system protein FeoA
MTTLEDLKIGEKGLITDLDGDQSIIQRLLEMGLTDGETVEVLRFAPLGDPLEIRVRGYNLSLRKREAAAVLIQKLS